MMRRGTGQHHAIASLQSSRVDATPDVFARIGLIMMAGGVATIALSGIVTRRVPAIIGSSASAGGVLPIVACAVATAAAIGLCSRVTRRVAALALAAVLVLGAAVAIASALSGTADATDWVAPVELLMLLSAVARLTSGALPVRMLAVAVTIVMLTLFGVIHLTRPQDIAVLLPAWLQRWTWLPLVSGSIMLAAAAAQPLPRWRAIAAASVAAMFGGWLIVIHVGRILADPADPFEWQFAAMAVALSGALLTVASGHSTKDNLEEIR